MKFLTENWFKVGILVLIGTGIYLQFNKNGEIKKLNTIKESGTSALSIEDQFKKKQECSKYRNEIDKKLKDSTYYVAETGYQNFAYLEEIFYSPKENSCLYLVKENGLVNKKLTYVSYTLIDALTSNVITSHLIETSDVNSLKEESTFLTTGLNYYR